MKYLIFLLLLGILVYPVIGFSQTTVSGNANISLPAVALIDIEPSGNIALLYKLPTDAGLPIVAPVANSSKWLNYTSAITLGGSSRIISASLNHTIPGVDIKIAASNAALTGGGVLGVPTGEVVLSTTPKIIVNGIRGAFTGSGSNRGHQLKFSLTTNNYSNLSATNNTVIIISYTISE